MGRETRLTGLSEQFRSALKDLSDAFDPAGITWAVTGAVAANQYRDQVRTTIDLDVILALTERDVAEAAGVLQKHGWNTSEVIDDWLIRAEHPNEGRLDLLVSQTDYERLAISRSERVSLDNKRSYKTLAIEDVLILKLIADRYQDNADVESILVTRPELDWDYMKKWLGEFDLNDRLDRIEDRAITEGRLTKKLSRKTDRSQGRTR